MATLCDDAAVQLKAGSDAATLTSGQYDQLIEQAEGFINTKSQHNWVDDYATINADFKKILEDVASSHAAISAIAYNMNGFLSRQIATVLIDTNIWRINQGMKLLEESQYRDAINEVS